MINNPNQAISEKLPSLFWVRLAVEPFGSSPLAIVSSTIQRLDFYMDGLMYWKEAEEKTPIAPCGI